jgi:hypothetical protein
MTRFLPLAVLLAVSVAACGEADTTPAQAASAGAATPPAPAATTAPAGVAMAATGGLPAVVVYKTASCGCCKGWVEHLEGAGFTVDARDVTDLMSIKRDAGVSAANASCHTALVDGYVVEGHVPADVVKRLLAERPQVAGIAVPGMPVGSPGMEGPGAKPYQVVAFDREGGTTVYTTVDPR